MMQIESGVNGVSAGMMRGFKQAGFSDAQIGGFLDMTAIGGGGGGGVVFLLEEEVKKGGYYSFVRRCSAQEESQARGEPGGEAGRCVSRGVLYEDELPLHESYMMYHGTEIDVLGTGIDVVGGTQSNVVEDKHSSIAAGRGGIMVLGNEAYNL